MSNPSTPINTQSTVEKNISISTRSQILSAAILGFVLMMGVGFAPQEVAHNAAHDTRHSFAFPCH